MSSIPPLVLFFVIVVACSSFSGTYKKELKVKKKKNKL
jgi:hypothetical protein